MWKSDIGVHTTYDGYFQLSDLCGIDDTPTEETVTFWRWGGEYDGKGEKIGFTYDENVKPPQNVLIEFARRLAELKFSCSNEELERLRRYCTQVKATPHNPRA